MLNMKVRKEATWRNDVMEIFCRQNEPHLNQEKGNTQRIRDSGRIKESPREDDGFGAV